MRERELSTCCYICIETECRASHVCSQSAPLPHHHHQLHHNYLRTVWICKRVLARDRYDGGDNLTGLGLSRYELEPEDEL